ncbi:ABC transporter permease [Streptomyces resistomycificus]|uniref:ABC transporter n=1 Tax=Streptomyces resistomycificus TaxID=67356 RepID=A0A0L8L4X7_9ACTN|nr:ABC transporter permease [Streptomyces resistomycificus]KOG33197.1 ABC transporter [Streptomyces resistomycificus]KUN96711.1 ABC transporter [Streptomyces resistomycificus]
MQPGDLQAAPPAVRSESRRSWAAVFALARFEARDLLRYAVVLVTLFVYVGYTLWGLLSEREGMDAFPALQNVDRGTQTAPLLLGIALLVCVNRATLRSRRRDTDRHFDVLVMEPWRRTVAHVLSVVPFAILTALVVLGEFTWQALRPGAVGHGSVAELAVGPLTVLLCGALGVLMARLVPVVFAAPVLVIGLFTFSVFLSAGTGDAEWSRWLAPVVGETSSEALPSDLMGRPAAWHALYLIGLVLLPALGAVLVGGGRAWPLKAGLAGALALALTGAVAQSGGVSAELTAARERATDSPEKEQSCVREGASTYCAFPEWTGRAATWAETVERVQSLAGGSAAKQRLLVRQRIDATYGLSGDSALATSTTPHQVTVGTRWGGNRVPEFASAVASVLVAGDETKAGELCDGRMVTVMWLAVGGADTPLTELRNVRLDDALAGSAIVLTPTNPLSMSAGQTAVVVDLLKRPRAEVTAAVKDHWKELTAPGVTTAQVARVLGAEVPEESDDCEA